MDMQVHPAVLDSVLPASTPATASEGGAEAELHAELWVMDDVRIDQLMRWHGNDERNLPPSSTLKNLSRDTVAALQELQSARASIVGLRAAMSRAFWATDFREVHAILLTALGPPPEDPPA